MTDQIIQDVPLAASVSGLIMQMEPDRDWLERRLHMALAYIDRIEAERQEEHAAHVATTAAHVATTAAYTKLAEMTRSYLADPCTNARVLIEFYLAKAPK